MYYIISNGTRGVRLNKQGHVEECLHIESDYFDERKAKNIYANLPKVMKNLHFRLIRVPEITVSKDDNRNIKTIECQDNQLPDLVQEWIDKISNLNGLVLSAQSRQEELIKDLKRVEKDVLNIYHSIELGTNLNAAQGYKAYQQLRTILRKRRRIKDELFIVSEILNSNVTDVVSENLTNKANRLLHRKYTYR